MISAPIPNYEQERLEELYRYCILDTPFEQSFNEMVQLAAKICDTPISLVTIIDKDRQWFKAAFGVDIRETPRDISFCSYTILNQDIFEVPDTLEDERFADNPLVLGEPFIRFYAGVPLRTSGGHQLGTICVLDNVPRSLTEDQKFTLSVLGKRIVQQMEYDRKEKQLKDIDSLFGRHYINVLDSIDFGEKIQKRLVFQQSELQKQIKNSFVLFKQKSIISNAFCFLKEDNGEIFLAQFDSEKEGFAGLFLGSVVQENLIWIIEEGQITDLGAILYQLNKCLHKVINANNIVHDWTLNIGLCRINRKEGSIRYSGAGKPLFVISDSENAEKQGGEVPAFGGKSVLLTKNDYYEVLISPQRNASYYLFSSGLASQRGAEGDLGEARLSNLLSRIQKLPMDTQASVIWDVVDNWKGSYQQGNDILCLGFKL